MSSRVPIGVEVESGTNYLRNLSDHYVIIGSHHDSWTRGAADPASGMAILMEVSQSIVPYLFQGGHG